MTLTPLEVVQMANTGILVWNTVGPLLQSAMERGSDVTIEAVESASVQAGADLDALRAAIAAKRAAK